MNIDQKLLQEIEKILYYGASGGKTQKEATKLIDYIQFAFEEKLEKVPKEYWEFAQMLKNNWRKMQDLSLENQKKYLQSQVADLRKHIKN